MKTPSMLVRDILEENDLTDEVGNPKLLTSPGLLEEQHRGEKLKLLAHLEGKHSHLL